MLCQAASSFYFSVMDNLCPFVAVDDFMIIIMYAHPIATSNLVNASMQSLLTTCHSEEANMMIIASRHTMLAVDVEQ